MIPLRLLFAALLLAAPAVAQDRSITDATGRTVSVPARVFAAGPGGATR